jgi:hypothetical protein
MRLGLCALIALLCLYAAAARADSQYCFAGLPDQSDQAFFERVRNGCQPGDVIVLPAGFAGAIGLFCDFDRQIVAAGDKILCIKVGTRETRPVK